MFKKILIANRGEIAARVIRTCRDRNIATVAVYTPRDLGSLHVRLADEAMPLTSPKRYGDAEEILEIAQRVGADAIHPGYGFLAEEADFARACEAVGITFIGPSATVLETLRAKHRMLARAQAAGFPTPAYSSSTFAEGDEETLRVEAERLGLSRGAQICARGPGPGHARRLIPLNNSMRPFVRRGPRPSASTAMARCIWSALSRRRRTSTCRCWPISTAM